jgi:hypothetical protein
LKKIPIRTIDFSDPVDKARHDRMVALVTQILEIRFWPSGQRRIREELIRVLRCLNNSGLQPLRAKTALRRNRPISSRILQDARLEQEKTLLSRQIQATDASIDKLVYELYGLTEEEIKVVEGK